MNRTGATPAVILALTLAAGTSAAQTAQPTQADFDACNRMAQASVGQPSAMPGPQPPTSGTGQTPPTITSPDRTPDTTAGVRPGGGEGKTGPMITGTGRTPDAPGGVASGTGAVAKEGAGADQASDARLRGIGGALKDDMAYREAYRRCMQSRGW